MRTLLVGGLVLLGVTLFPSCDKSQPIVDGTIITTQGLVPDGIPASLIVERGPQWTTEKSFGAIKVRLTPQCAVWCEDTLGNHIQTLYVTRRFALQDWGFAKHDPAVPFRTMCMPYWMNKYVSAGQTVPAKNAPMPDAITAATPTGSFTLQTKLPRYAGPLVILCELNRSFDTNETYSAKREESKFNGQPSLVYAARIDALQSGVTVPLELIGHGGEVGDDPALYSDLASMSTAREMAASIRVRID
jgi:hypothetical protein